MIDSSILQGKKAAFFTLGCKLNFAETSTVAQQLMRYGVTKATKDEVADLLVVNTCSVTEVADHKCRQAIHRLVKQHPGAFVVVTGCYAQLKPQEIIDTDGVDLVLGSEQKASIIPAILNGMTGAHTVKTADIRSFAPSCSRGDRTRYFLKVQDGCNYFCTYCTIPFARGNSRNPSIKSLVEQARKAAAEGGKEIVITGVNIGDFGQTTGERFIDLVKALDSIEEIKRYRISSLEPDLIDEELIEYCAKSRAFMPHFHIPLQSGSDSVLKLMHRHYDSALFAEKIRLIKRLMPEAFLGIDVMVGTRGETPEYFEETYNLLNELPVTQLHVFPYSERPGTAALKIPYVVSAQDKKLRSQRLLDLSEQKTQDFYAKYIGTEAEVLFEKAPRGKAMHGFTANYIRVELPAIKAKEEYDNEILRVRLNGFNRDKSALICEVI